MIRKSKPGGGPHQRRPGAGNTGSMRSKIPGSVRRTLVDTDLRSLRSSMRDVFRRGSAKDEVSCSSNSGSGGSSC